MKTIVVIPAYNEESMIGSVVNEVRQITPHVLVVDDGSADETMAAAAAAGAAVLRHAVNRGQGAALQTGLDAALAEGADIVVTFDADGQMCAPDIPALVAPVEAGLCDVALGSRFLETSGSSQTHPRMPVVRRLTLKTALAFTKLTTGLRLTDTHNGARAISRQAAKRINLHCDRMAHASELLEQIALHGLRYREVPVTVRYTDYSLQKGQKLSGALKILRDLFISTWLR